MKKNGLINYTQVMNMVEKKYGVTVKDKIRYFGYGVAGCYLGLISINYAPRLANQLFPTFDGNDYAKRIVTMAPLDVDGDGKQDGVFVAYDLNNNGKPDTGAIYKIEGDKLNTNAKFLVVDPTEDGKELYHRIDKNENGILGKKRPGNLEEKILKENW